MVMALYIPHSGKFIVRKLQLTNMGSTPTRVSFEIPKRNVIVGEPRTFEVVLKSHKIVYFAAGSLQVAYWPEIWEDWWGQDEVDLFFKNETERQKFK